MSSASSYRAGLGKGVQTRRKILVVEDHSDARQMLSIALTKVGLEVLTTSVGAAALVMVREHKPAMVLLDITLADSMNGVTVCEKIKADPHSQPIGVIMMSGHKDQASIDAAKQAGADAYLVKPFRLSKLLNLVSEDPFPQDTFTLVLDT